MACNPTAIAPENTLSRRSGGQDASDSADGGGALVQKKRGKKSLPPLIVVVLLVAAFLLRASGVLPPEVARVIDRYLPSELRKAIPQRTVSDADGTYLVERVVDGDTLVLANGDRVRLIGVDTPETKHPTKPVEAFGPEASAFTRKSVEGQSVTLKFDREKYDRYQRVLAYVYRDDWCLNEGLIRAGLSECVTKYPFDSTMKARFREAEDEARRARRGIWSNATPVAVR
ncbi:MAG: thermonuclease family protein [Planctomycetota bacterium]